MAKKHLREMIKSISQKKSEKEEQPSPVEKEKSEDQTPVTKEEVKEETKEETKEGVKGITQQDVENEITALQNNGVYRAELLNQLQELNRHFLVLNNLLIEAIGEEE